MSVAQSVRTRRIVSPASLPLIVRVTRDEREGSGEARRRARDAPRADPLKARPGERRPVEVGAGEPSADEVCIGERRAREHDTGEVRAGEGVPREVGPWPDEVPLAHGEAGRKGRRTATQAPRGDARQRRGREVGTFQVEPREARPLEVGAGEVDARPDEIERLLAVLSPSSARVLRLRYGIGGDRPRTASEVAAMLGISSERVRQVEARALASLRRRITPLFWAS